MVVDPFCNPSREVKPFSPATAMSGFEVEAAETRTSAKVSFCPLAEVACFIQN
jgi:hypothetical protein